ncbi:MAG: hypothetical protein IJA16_04225 [Clostridia bacterium]|nr:hypothetical protein [Clostridia bacterium]
MDKRIIIMSGHYGSGKTNIAVNFALDLKDKYDKVTIADIDIVNPYFRTKDSEEQLKEAGIRLICSEYANSNVDIPALPQEIYSVTDDKTQRCILDVGGDERGALALGRIAPYIREENDYEMIYVVNMYRPLTRDADSAIEVMREIEAACKISFTAIINNSNLGAETTAEDVLNSVAYAKEISEKTGIPIKFTTVEQALLEPLKNKIKALYPLRLQRNSVKECL